MKDNQYLKFLVVFLFTFLFANLTTEDIQNKNEEWPVCDPNYLDGSYSIEHNIYCDRFFLCYNGIPYLMQCEDGFAYMPFQGCKLLHEVDCTNRTKLQVPRGSGDCLRLYGLFKDPQGCGKYLSCYNGTATLGNCPLSLVFDDNGKFCRLPTDEEKLNCLLPSVLSTTSTPVLHYFKGSNSSNNGANTTFQCPGQDILPFGDHSRHSYPGNCKYFIMCLKDGNIKLGGCDKGMGFNSITGVCEPEINIEDCSSQTTPLPIGTLSTEKPILLEAKNN